MIVLSTRENRRRLKCEQLKNVCLVGPRMNWCLIDDYRYFYQNTFKFWLLKSCSKHSIKSRLIANCELFHLSLILNSQFFSYILLLINLNYYEVNFQTLPFIFFLLQMQLGLKTTEPKHRSLQKRVAIKPGNCWGKRRSGTSTVSRGRARININMSKITPGYHLQRI